MSIVDELDKLASLRERGLLTVEEFQREKSRLLNGEKHDSNGGASRTHSPSMNSKKGISLAGKIGIGILVAVAVFLTIGIIHGNRPEVKERFQAKDAIELCWKEQSRKSLAPSTQRFVAGTCEKMEDDFRRKYGRNP